LPSNPFARHPWETARAAFFVELVSRRDSGVESIAVLDVGAGDGYLGRRLLTVLPSGSRVVCFDPNYTAEHLQTLNLEAPPGLTFSRERVAVKFDWLLLLDVLEHVPDDVAMLTNLVDEQLKGGGYALISVPAWPQLFTNHDVMLGHYRRYRPLQLASVIGRSGLQSLDGGSLFASLLLPRLLAKLRERALGIHSVPLSGAPDAHANTEVSDWRGGRGVTSAVSWVLGQDSRAVRTLSRVGILLPGLSTWALARKPEDEP